MIIVIRNILMICLVFTFCKLSCFAQDEIVSRTSIYNDVDFSQTLFMSLKFIHLTINIDRLGFIGKKVTRLFFGSRIRWAARIGFTSLYGQDVFLT